MIQALVQQSPLQTEVLDAMADSRKIISHSQFANLEGGSRELGTMKEGRKGGYYVSRDPRVPVEIGGSLEKTASTHNVGAIQSHFEDMKALASKIVPTGYMKARAATPEEREAVHQGIWTDKGTAYLDVSDRIGKRASESSLREALHRGISQNQLAIWAAGSQKSLSTHIEDEHGRKQVNPAAEKTLSYLNQRQQARANWRKMTPAAKEDVRQRAIADIKKAAEIHRESGRK